ncbi:HAD family phosphatase [Quadrisphaera sp. DSM 44207]|uniref:HAD family hydrolase n=1 Tax=Quadrisphaera sp. DSM 44207 TaxID=1881057 RepID=UPI000883636D|nr:HAD family phosphatase [Quadrisphaera sp. DSM 44207]SDQ33990.1 haloacid dehalogenase superfamily, subfamily IA, variant 3 with third motif having DD or ED [Quadrisphaera sp. DSM 44207]
MSAGPLDLARTTVLLCDADGTLFPSEEPAYAASADVMNRFLAQLGAERSFSPAEQQAMTNGKNFRAASQQLAASYGAELAAADLERWVAEEKDVVTTHLRTVLRPDPQVLEPVQRLAERFVLAAVTSSARSRLDACLAVTGLDPLFDPQRRFSAEDSLPVPTSKPDPAVYVVAGQQLGITPDDGLAVEDSINGALSAVAAGYRTVGTVQFVPPPEREARSSALREAGAVAVVASWAELVDLLAGGPRPVARPSGAAASARRGGQRGPAPGRCARTSRP